MKKNNPATKRRTCKKSFSLYGCMAETVEILDDIVEFNTVADWNMYDEETNYLH